MKCGTSTCEAEATHEVFWPGQLLMRCEPCALHAAHISEAMGFALVVRPLAAEAREKELDAGLDAVLALRALRDQLVGFFSTHPRLSGVEVPELAEWVRTTFDDAALLALYGDVRAANEAREKEEA